MSAEVTAALITVLGGVAGALIGNWHNLFPREKGTSRRRPGRTAKNSGDGGNARRIKYWPPVMGVVLGAVVSGMAFRVPELARNLSSRSSFSGVPDAKPLTNVVLRDDFDDNLNRWPLSERFEILEGAYRVRSTTTTGWELTTPVPQIKRGDFQIDTRVRKRSGNDGFFFGLVWGYRDHQNFANLAITGDGRVAVSVKDNDVWADYADADELRPEVQKRNAVNALRIEKRGAEMRFFVNDHIVEHRMDPATIERTLAGDGVGFVLRNDIELEFDYLIVSQP